MTNQTLVAVPPNVDQPEVLGRFLRRLVEQLDILLGNRGLGADSYVPQSQLTSSGLSLSDTISAVVAQLEKTASELNGLSTTVEAFVLASDASYLRIAELMWQKAFALNFIGRNTNGAVTMTSSYNVASGTRTGTGVYNFVLEQDTIGGVDITSNLSAAVTHKIAASSVPYDVELEVTGTGTFTVRVYDVSSGSRVLYDPDTAGDYIDCAGMLNAEGELPAA